MSYYLLFICASSLQSRREQPTVSCIACIISCVNNKCVSLFAGNIEILHDGKWGNICDDEWDLNEAHVICRQLGFAGCKKITHSGWFGTARRTFLFFWHTVLFDFVFALALILIWTANRPILDGWCILRWQRNGNCELSVRWMGQQRLWGIRSSRCYLRDCRIKRKQKQQQRRAVENEDSAKAQIR